MRKSNKAGLSWSTNISARIADHFKAIPVIVLIVVCGAIMLADGIITSNYNIAISDFVTGGVFNIAGFKHIVWLTVGLLLADRGKMLTMRIFTMRKINIEYLKIFRRIRKSKVADINNVTTGKAMDAAQEICKFQADLISLSFNMIPYLVPFTVMIWRVRKENGWMSFVIFASVLIATSIMVVCERYFCWDQKAKDAKSKLRSVTTDNFINITTCKYINEETYPDKRLLDNQNNTFKYEVNVFRMFVYTFAIAAMWAPTLINVFISKNNMGMISYVFFNEYVIHGISNSLVNIIENRIECRNTLRIIETLKGDDVEVQEVFRGQMDLSGTVFTHKPREDEEPIEFLIEDVVLEQNKRYLITGNSGEGKSSFATYLAGGLNVKEGCNKYYKSFYIWQETSLFNDTLIKNIIPNEPEGTHIYWRKLEKIKWFAEELGLANFINNETPNGWNSIVGERGCYLSSGQKQRINIIRALMEMDEHPENIFILDEITSNLDAKSRKKAFELLDKHCKSTLVIISHNKGFESYVDKNIKVQNHVFRMVKNRSKRSINVVKAS